MEIAIGIYLILINGANFILMGMDKQRARANAWRIPEKTFFILSLLGGAFGGWIGMYTYRHKTKHWYFVVGIPMIFIIELAIALYLLDFLHRL